MGSEKETVKTETQTQQTQQATATPEETALNKLTLERAQAAQPGQLELQKNMLNLVNALALGQDFPGYLSGLPGGISPEMTTDISRQAISDIRPSFQVGGILDSGVAAAISGRVAGDVRRASAEFNIGNLLNLLNLAVGGQAQVQQPLLAQTAGLGAQLAGLRQVSTTRTGTGTGTQTTANPFLQNFQSSLGQTFGGARL